MPFFLTILILISSHSSFNSLNFFVNCYFFWLLTKGSFRKFGFYSKNVLPIFMFILTIFFFFSLFGVVTLDNDFLLIIWCFNLQCSSLNYFGVVAFDNDFLLII